MQGSKSAYLRKGTQVR